LKNETGGIRHTTDEIADRKAIGESRRSQDQRQSGKRVLGRAQANCYCRKIAVHELIFKVNNERKRGGLSSALRLFVLECYRQQAAAKSAPDQLSARPENKITR
jgi:hypothetical protein